MCKGALALVIACGLLAPMATAADLHYSGHRRLLHEGHDDGGDDVQTCRLCYYLHARQYQNTDLAFAFRFPEHNCLKIQTALAMELYDALPYSLVLPFGWETCNGTYLKICGRIATNFTSDPNVSITLDKTLDRMFSWWSGYNASNGYCPARLAGYIVSLRLAGDTEDPDFPEEAPFPDDCGGIGLGTGDWCDLPTDASDYGSEGLPWSCPGSMDQLSTRFAIRNTYTVTSRRNTIQYCFTTTNVKPKSPNSTCGSSRTLRTVQFWADASQSSKLVAVSTRARKGAVRTSPPAWATTPPGAAPLNILRVPQLNWSPEQAEGGQICLELAKGTDINSFCLSLKRGQCWASLLDESEDCCPLYGASSPPNVSL